MERAPGVVLATCALMLAANLTAVGPVRGDVPRSWVFPLRIHVATPGGAATVTQAWIDERVVVANDRFQHTGVSFVVGEQLPLIDPVAIRRPGDILGLASQCDHRRWIDVFVVESLWIRRELSGSCGSSSARFVTVARSAGLEVVAHELGHFFDLRHASGTLMQDAESSGRVAHVFSARQEAEITGAARRFAATGLPAPMSVGY